MPGMQFFGTAPARQSPMSQIMEGYQKGAGGREKREAAQFKRGIDLAKIGYTQKKGAADIMIKALDNATPQQRDKILAEGSDTSNLLKDVYGQEALDSLSMVTAGKGKAAKIAKVTTWIKTKKKSAMGFSIPRSKKELDTDIALELSDADWKENYPEVAAEFSLAYRAPEAKPKAKPWWQGGKGKKIDYSTLSEGDLFNKAMAGDKQAIAEAVRKGYPVGGK